MESEKKRESKRITRAFKRSELQDSEDKEQPSSLKNTARRFKLERKTPAGELAAPETAPSTKESEEREDDILAELKPAEPRQVDAIVENKPVTQEQENQSEAKPVQASNPKALPFSPVVFDQPVEPVVFETAPADVGLPDQEVSPIAPTSIDVEIPTMPASTDMPVQPADNGSKDNKHGNWQPLLADNPPPAVRSVPPSTPLALPKVTPSVPVIPAVTPPVPKPIQIKQPQPLFVANRSGEKRGGVTPLPIPAALPPSAQATLFPKKLGAQQSTPVGQKKAQKSRKKMIFLLLLVALTAGATVYFAFPDTYQAAVNQGTRWMQRCAGLLKSFGKEPSPADKPPLVTPPQVEEIKGWFGEKLPDGMSKNKQCGEYLWKKDNSVMVYVPEGTFWRGDDTLGNETERPLKQISLAAFYLDKYELTNEQYQKFAQATGHAEAIYANKGNFNHPRLPVVGISWQDAQDYAKWAQKRLPSEAEWEKAARGGMEIPDWQNTTGVVALVANPLPRRRYPWGNETNLAGRANSSVPQDGHVYAAPPGSFKDGVSPYNCFDMAGNVWEWCQDSYQALYYQASPAKDPLALPANAKDKKVCRGGAWRTAAEDLFCFRRNAFLPTERQPYLGVRLAR